MSSLQTRPDTRRAVITRRKRTQWTEGCRIKENRREENQDGATETFLQDM